MGSQFRQRGYRAGELVHLTVRGFRRETRFHDAADRDAFFEGFHELNEALSGRDRLGVLAHAGMPNHAHLFVRNGESEWAITKVMHSLKTSYATDYNWRHGRKGQVFERPFRGKIIRTGEHVANTFAYIHLNPDASLRMENSSHAFYAGLKEDPHIDPTIAWKAFGGRDGYLEYFSDTARLRQARAAAKYRFEQ